MERSVAAETLSTCREQRVAGRGCEQTDAGLVARADRRVAEDSVSPQREHARVPRDHLPQPVHSSAWSAKERADGPSARSAACAARATPANMDTPGDRSSMPSRSAKGLPKRKIERFPVTGKEICWPVARTVTLRH